MFVSGAIAGLVGAIIVLGSQFRFIDDALLTPSYTWSGLMAALLANGVPDDVANDHAARPGWNVERRAGEGQRLGVVGTGIGVAQTGASAHRWSARNVQRSRG